MAAKPRKPVTSKTSKTSNATSKASAKASSKAAKVSAANATRAGSASVPVQVRKFQDVMHRNPTPAEVARMKLAARLAARRTR